MWVILIIGDFGQTVAETGMAMDASPSSDSRGCLHATLHSSLSHHHQILQPNRPMSNGPSSNDLFLCTGWLIQLQYT